ncbi:unnamed protein product [Ectocarpus sp. 4 AP-2014]
MSTILSCETGFKAIGLQEGEDNLTPIRVLSTLVSVSVVSAWCSWTKVKRLSLFFAHWLSGLVWGLCFVVEDMMVTVCWTESDLIGFIKAVKFIEFVSSNMMAITHLAICVNLALIVSSHRTLTRVQSVSSPWLLSLLLAISIGITSVTVPLWETVYVHGTGFWIVNSDQGSYDAVVVSIFFLEFMVGICMIVIVAWLLLFRMKEVKECWRIDERIRYYFCLTLLGTAVNIAIGICSTLFVIGDTDEPRLAIWSWASRYIHVALDTFVLYGVLREKDIDERGGNARSSNNNCNDIANSSGLIMSNRHGKSARRSDGSSTNTTNPATHV